MNLSRSEILGAAIAILDEYGLADLTMRRLATSLGVQPGALYWHFPNKQTLLGALSDRILEDVDAPLLVARPWDRQVREIARRLREALLAHRDGAELVSASYSSRLSNSRAREAFSTALRGAGLSSHDAELSSHVLLHFVLGLTAADQSRLQLEEMGALTRGGISPDAPEGDRARDDDLHAADPAERFEFGLDTFVGGLAHRLRADAS